ncbi:hypothetical protein K504DRAFT_531966 [Pleomassaria siparia CBS 279.74]|uniref:CBF1-interacting co-repressor CIR N-terminal domain-containing protein n=1 Tax=Pleomassaria siparia CBS 279.74 TaxID=1314801 RepID=A0A6G1KFN9_9PLEO|nr:hypothetical protein K504DRAFT_531966 [Pleomassaria siparia CBS 279.74]
MAVCLELGGWADGREISRRNVVDSAIHLLGKKSWNVYNPASIARVKADEAAAAAREAADEQRMQELDAERRAAILRGQTPPPLPEEETNKDERGTRRADKTRDNHDRKRRKLAGEDETDMEIRLAKTTTGSKEGADAAVLKLRKPANDAPLEDHAGNINLFPVDPRETKRREKNAEAEKEKRKKEQSFADQYTMRLANAAGKGGLENPWYAAKPQANPKEEEDGSGAKLIGYPGFAEKDVWGNEDLRRKERQQNQIVSNDPFALMQKAQVHLKKSKEDKKKWAAERDRELRELRATQEREWRRDRHGKRKERGDEDDVESFSVDVKHHARDRPSRHQRGHKSRSPSRERRHERTLSHRHDRKRSRSQNRERRAESSRNGQKSHNGDSGRKLHRSANIREDS